MVKKKAGGAKAPSEAASSAMPTAAVGDRGLAAPTPVTVPAPVVSPAPVVMPKITTRYAVPDGWQKIPVDVRPIWSPGRSMRPIIGWLMGQQRLEAEGVTVLIFRLIAETDVVVPGGAPDESGKPRMATAKPGEEVIVPIYYGLGALAPLLGHPEGVRYQVFVGNQRKLEIDGADVWDFEIVANPAGAIVK
jgi:hypothetical protein